MVDNFSELGRTGLKTSGGIVLEEFLGQLRGSRGRKVYREMADNDPIVGGVLLAFSKMLARLDWHIEVHEDATPADHEIADFVQECLDDMSESWDATLENILSELTYGWSFHEIVYKKRDGAFGVTEGGSRFSDGRIGWRKWPIRSQESLHTWVFDENGGIQGMTQNVWSGGSYTIPIEKALLFRTSTARNSPEGRSLLRNAYRAWFFKKRIEEIEAIGVERDLAGLPVARLAPEYFAQNATADQVAIREYLTDLVANIKRNEVEGIVFPAQYDDRGNKMIDLELLSSGGSRQFDTDKIIGRYNQQIAMSMLADFLMLGHENVGTQSLGVSKVELWTLAVEAVAKSIAEVVNKHAIPRLLKLNGMNVEDLPRLVFGSVERVDLGELATYIKTLSDAGAIMPDFPLEDFLRTAGNLPPRDEEQEVGANPPTKPATAVFQPGENQQPEDIEQVKDENAPDQ